LTTTWAPCAAKDLVRRSLRCGTGTCRTASRWLDFLCG